MTAKFDQNPIITKFTTTYLSSTGWYEIDEEYQRETNWGLRRGCNFFGTTPTTYCIADHEEYKWPIESSRCSIDYMLKGTVAISSDTDYMENCKTIVPMDKVGNDSVSCVSSDRGYAQDQTNAFLQETFGADSRCFMGQYRHKSVSIDVEPIMQPVCQKAKVNIEVFLEFWNRIWKFL